MAGGAEGGGEGVVLEETVEGAGQGVGIAGGHEQAGIADDLGEGAGVRGDHWAAPGHRLQRRQAEPLGPGRNRQGRGAPVQRVERGLVDTAGGHHARPVDWRWRSPPGRTGDHQPEIGVARPAQAGVGGQEHVDALAGLHRPHEQHVGPGPEPEDRCLPARARRRPPDRRSLRQLPLRTKWLQWIQRRT